VSSERLEAGLEEARLRTGQASPGDGWSDAHRAQVEAERRHARPRDEEYSEVEKTFESTPSPLTRKIAGGQA
jgi:hypothetical protein